MCDRHLVFLVFLLFSVPVRSNDAQSEPFKRTDSNCDGKTNVADSLFTLEFLFVRGAAPCCIAAADATDDGEVDAGDPLFALSYFFGRGRRRNRVRGRG